VVSFIPSFFLGPLVASAAADSAHHHSLATNIGNTRELQKLPYLALNSSNVSSSCPALLLTPVVLNPALAVPTEVAGAATGALLADRKAGLKKPDVGLRAARRKTEVDAIVRRCGGGV
jgi:hypothetical protein